MNVLEKHGGNTWHGAGIFYYRSDLLQAKDRPDIGTTTGLRLNPSESLNTTTRLSESAQFYQPKEDQWKLLEPGFELGGYILKDKLWIFSSYIPSLYRQTRTVLFNAGTPKAAPRSYPSTDTTHYALGRLDWQALKGVRVNFGWHYAYRKAQGLGTTPIQIGRASCRERV